MAGVVVACVICFIIGGFAVYLIQRYIVEHYKDFAHDTDIPIYVRKLWNLDENIGELWDEDVDDSHGEWFAQNKLKLWIAMAKSNYVIEANHYILDFLSRPDLKFVDIKSSRLSSSVFSKSFWKRFVELLMDEENFIVFTFVLPTNINTNVLRKKSKSLLTSLTTKQKSNIH